MYKYLTPMFICSITAGCMSDTAQTQMPIEKSGTGGTINYCRPASITRFAEAPVLYVENTPQAEIQNGSYGSVPIEINQTYRFSLKPNALFMRVTNQTAFQGTASSRQERHFLISGKANVEQGLAVFTGGIIGAAIADQHQDTGTENWAIVEVPKTEFYNKCGPIK